MVLETILGRLSNGALHFSAGLTALVLEANAEHRVVVETRRTSAVRQSIRSSVRLEVWHEALSSCMGGGEQQQTTEQN